jgi:hypothetical protein
MDCWSTVELCSSLRFNTGACPGLERGEDSIEICDERGRGLVGRAIVLGTCAGAWGLRASSSESCIAAFLRFLAFVVGAETEDPPGIGPSHRPNSSSLVGGWEGPRLVRLAVVGGICVDELDPCRSRSSESSAVASVGLVGAGFFFGLGFTFGFVVVTTKSR